MKLIRAFVIQFEDNAGKPPGPSDWHINAPAGFEPLAITFVPGRGVVISGFGAPNAMLIKHPLIILPIEKSFLPLPGVEMAFLGAVLLSDGGEIVHVFRYGSWDALHLMEQDALRVARGNA